MTLHRITSDFLLTQLKDSTVLVVGDLMLDRYWHGDTQRVSPEAPVPVVRVGEIEDRLGGAANVARNIMSLGGQATLVGVIGDDRNGQRLQDLLEETGARAEFVRRDGWDTITKLRVISRHQQLIRLDFEEPLEPDVTVDLTARVAPLLGKSQILVLSDYAKGALQDPQALIEKARKADVPVVVDPKRVDFESYRGAAVLTPNAAEFEAVVGPWQDEADMEQRARRLIETLDFGALLITRGEQGMTLVVRDGASAHLPTMAREVFDVTGAGDTVVASLAAGLASGMELADAAALSNAAAGVVVGKLGTADVSPVELQRAIAEQHPDEHGVLDEDELLRHVARARARGERIVMTNGCFDILHPGHVAYLEQAAALGDRLVVAVNDDGSVTRLKGPDRPINTLSQRSAVLAGLRAVDWVVGFSEDTPERLICAMKPDCLVKGGDYRPEEIAGGDCVRESGGEVVVLDFVEGFSTTAIIQALAPDSSS